VLVEMQEAMEMILFFRVALTLAEMPKQLLRAVRVTLLLVGRVVVMVMVLVLVALEQLVKDSLVVLLYTHRLGILVAVAVALEPWAVMLLAVTHPEMVEQD